MPHLTTRRTVALVAAAPLSVALLSGCGDDSPSVSAGSATAASSSAAPSSQASSSSDAPSTSEAPSTTAAPSSTAPTTTAAPNGTSRDPGTILRTSKTSTNAAKSSHVVGDVVEDGEKMHIDARGQVQTSNQEVTVKTAKSGTITIRTINASTHYIKGDRTYWTKQGAPAATASKLAGKYIKAPADKTAGFTSFTMKKLLTDMTDGFDDSKINSVNTTVTPKKQGAQSVLQLAPRFSTETTAITVIDNPKRLPLQITSKEGKVSMSEWDAVPAYTAPPASQQVAAPGSA